MVKKEDDIANQIKIIGCCGAYCKTCPPFIENYCKGCKLGYDTGKRDINDAKCKMKVCCFKEKKLETCADCSDYSTCKIMLDFHSKNGYKYKKYKQSIEFIRKNGYDKFLKIAKDWKRAYGRLDKVTMKKQDTKNSLFEIPGVGPSIANDFNKKGIKKISDLKDKNPEELYLKICAIQGGQVDRCVLYVCRSSVYFAENRNADPEKLKWWNWKNSKNDKIEENN